MQTISTKVIPATNTKSTRIKAVTSSGVSHVFSADKFGSIEDAHRGSAYALMLELKWSGTMIGGDTKDGKVWVFFDIDAPVIANNAKQTIVNIHTGNAAFADSQSELGRIFELLKDSAELQDLHSNKLYDVNGNTCGYVKQL